MAEEVKLKFRAWDRTGKVMIYSSPRMNPLYLTLSGDLVEIDREGDEVPARNYELLEWTGLRDRNGKEIYEGDILRRYPRHKYPHDWTVTYSIDEGFGLSKSAQSDYEVVGNIYEDQPQ